jgi:hypothetical protein
VTAFVNSNFFQSPLLLCSNDNIVHKVILMTLAQIHRFLNQGFLSLFTAMSTSTASKALRLSPQGTFHHIAQSAVQRSATQKQLHSLHLHLCALNYATEIVCIKQEVLSHQLQASTGSLRLESFYARGIVKHVSLDAGSARKGPQHAIKTKT